jgi:6-pyruvoyl-tetrahydropterin synthase
VTKQEVKEKMKQFTGYILQEKEIKEKLLKLKLVASDMKILKDRIAEQDNLLAEIDILRKEKMLPLIEEIAQFISKRQKEIIEDESITDKDLDSMVESARKEMANDKTFKDFVEKFKAGTI